jgi:hypothetical protein
MVEDASVYLGIAYLCENALGSSHYYAALASLEAVAIIGGKSADDAAILADSVATAIKSDVKKKAPLSKASACLDRMLAAQASLRVSTAKFKKAAAADSTK